MPASGPQAVFVGLVCVDMVAEVAALPEEDTEVAGLSLRQAVGGNAANSSWVAAALGLQSTLLAPMPPAEHVRVSLYVVTARLPHYRR